MSNEVFLSIIGTVFTSGLALVRYFVKKMVSDLEQKVTNNQLLLAKGQDKLDLIVTDFKTDVAAINKAISNLEKNLEVMGVMLKNLEGNSREKIEMIAKNQSSLGELLEKIYAFERQLGKNYGKVTVKDE